MKRSAFSLALFAISAYGVVGLTGCASLTKQVQSNIHIGDPASHVEAVLGKPDSFGPSQKIEGGTAWYYTRQGESCGFALKDDIVKLMGCQTDPNYVSPMSRAAQATGIMLKGMGDGLQNSAREPATSAPPQQTNCTTRQIGYTLSTTCN